MSVSIKSWGNTVWSLFHTIAQQIDEEKFINQKNNIIELTLLICRNLPCPDCASDANNILKNFNLVKILSNKQTLIKFYFDFHNFINKKLKKPLFNENELENKYNSTDIKQLSINTINILNNQPKIPKLMNSNFRRKISVPKIVILLNSIVSSIN